MKTETTATPERQSAEANIAVTIWLAWLAVVYFVVALGVEISIWKGWIRVPAHQYGDGPQQTAFTGILLLWFLRRSGIKNLTHELTGTETISKSAVQLNGDPVEWRYPSLPISKSNPLIWFGTAGAFWWFLQWNRNDFAYSVTIIWFVLATSFGITSLLFRRPFILRIDEKGIAGFRTLFGRARAPWSKIAICEIERFHSKRGDLSTRWFYFRSASGELLLMLTPLALLGLTTAEVDEVEADVRRRLGGGDE